ncbi:hypothetical protein [Olsenella sp. AGMB03486]|uniref:hypothetical protein n=1 Tax=Olsenella sp. AGMB03486 TaxID=3230364 RepID=UPI002A87E3BF|nr:hypothetical protein [Olsenella sp.]MDY3970010.1 hypothetical protein [Atopobiaceae bacterium]MDY5275070.1 hypothetical protein [Atopobiaceae bacterium]
MSEIGFKIQMLPQSLTEEETDELRRHYLVYAKAERDEGRDLHRDLDRIYTEVDRLAEEGKLLRLVTSLHESKHTVIFATDASMLSLREFQQAMLAEGRVVRLISESSPEINFVTAMMPTDLLLVVTTSNGFARRQIARIKQSRADKAIITASEDPDLHSAFNEVLTIGHGAEEGSAMHRIYATFGVTYFFDRLFTQYARAFDEELA